MQPVVHVSSRSHLPQFVCLTLKYNWMQLRMLGKKNKMNKILYMKRQRRKRSTTRDWSSRLPPSAPLFPFISLRRAHSCWHLRDVSLSLLLVFIPPFLADFFALKALTVLLLLIIQYGEASLMLFVLNSTVLVLQVGSPHRAPSGLKSSQGKIHFWNHHSAYTNLIRTRLYVQCPRGTLKKKSYIPQNFHFGLIVWFALLPFHSPSSVFLCVHSSVWNPNPRVRLLHTNDVDVQDTLRSMCQFGMQMGWLNFWGCSHPTGTRISVYLAWSLQSLDLPSFKGSFKQTLKIQDPGRHPTLLYKWPFVQSMDIQKAPDSLSLALPFIHPLSQFLKIFSHPFLSKVQTEGAKVARGIIGVNHVWRRNRDEQLVACPQFEQSSLVDGVEGVLGVWSPALGAHPLQELQSKDNHSHKYIFNVVLWFLFSSKWNSIIYLNGALVGGFLVDTLYQLVADAALVSVTGSRGRITEIHLDIAGRGQNDVRTPALISNFNNHFLSKKYWDNWKV